MKVSKGQEPIDKMKVRVGKEKWFGNRFGQSTILKCISPWKVWFFSELLPHRKKKLSTKWWHTVLFLFPHRENRKKERDTNSSNLLSVFLLPFWASGQHGWMAALAFMFPLHGGLLHYKDWTGDDVWVRVCRLHFLKKLFTHQQSPKFPHRRQTTALLAVDSWSATSECVQLLLISNETK